MRGGGLKAGRYAYVFYATNDTYAFALLAFARLLRQVGIRDDIDLLALHLPLSPPLEKAIREAGIESRPVSPPRQVRNKRFRDCLTKLRLFELLDYDRVVFADVDAIPLRRLDYLFELPIAGPVAAPLAYWVPQPFWTSALLVVEPSAACRRRVMHHVEAARRSWDCDMDILNAAFAAEIHTLPRDAFCLNSEWEEEDRPGYFPDPVDAYARVSLVHFTALGKPWSYSPEEVHSLRPKAHPIFYELWERWKRASDEASACLTA
ncbi:MAG: glycosyltransferase [Solirubrobacterales bacterium]